MDQSTQEKPPFDPTTVPLTRIELTLAITNTRKAITLIRERTKLGLPDAKAIVTRVQEGFAPTIIPDPDLGHIGGTLDPMLVELKLLLASARLRLHYLQAEFDRLTRYFNETTMNLLPNPEERELVDLVNSLKLTHADAVSGLRLAEAAARQRQAVQDFVRIAGEMFRQ